MSVDAKHHTTRMCLNFEPKPSLADYPLPKTKPVTQSWRYEGKPRPYKVIDIDELMRLCRISISNIYRLSKTKE